MTSCLPWLPACTHKASECAVRRCCTFERRLLCLTDQLSVMLAQMSGFKSAALISSSPALYRLHASRQNLPAASDQGHSYLIHCMLSCIALSACWWCVYCCAGGAGLPWAASSWWLSSCLSLWTAPGSVFPSSPFIMIEESVPARLSVNVGQDCFLLIAFARQFELTWVAHRVVALLDWTELRSSSRHQHSASLFCGALQSCTCAWFPPTSAAGRPCPTLQCTPPCAGL